MASAEIAHLVQKLRTGDIRALARAISLVEDGAAAADGVLSACFPYTGGAVTIGITGAPGAGKSSLADQMARHLLRAGERVGVLAVDPSSPYTGGALLGDRIRMQDHHANPEFYLRSMATRGALGGLARTTVDAASILDAAGFNCIFVETVGVGQDEIDIVRLADITLVVLVPGMGDDVQSIKAGIMEVADIFVINKSDREGADRVAAEVKAMQSHAQNHAEWIPPVLQTSSLSGDGIPALALAIESFHAWLACDHRLTRRRTSQWKQRLAEMVRHQILLEAGVRGLGDDLLQQHAAAIVSRTEDPFRMVPRLVKHLLTQDSRN